MTTLAVSADAILAQRCRADFWAFVRVFWHTVPGAAKLIPNWHMEVICKELQELALRVHAGLPKEYDVILNQAPGTSKSTLTTILFHPWLWTFFPRARILCASHTTELVLDLATKSRAVITSDLYRRLYPDIELSEDTDTKGLYRNNHGGDRLSCTVAGKTPMGQHAHIHICDDILDPKKARSELERLAAKSFLTEILPSRKVDKAVTPLILVMQRLCVGDPTDVVLGQAKKEHGTPVRHICMPDILCDHVSPSHLRAHYEANGGLFDPHRLSQAVMNRERAAMGDFAYLTQFRQLAHIPGGGMFRAEWFSRRCRAAPYKAKRIRYWDRASTLDGCATAGVLMAKDADGSYYVEDMVVGQWEPDERNKVMRATALKDRARYGPQNEPRIYVEAEGGSSGRDAWLGVVRSLEGFPVYEDRVTGAKDVRAEPWATQLASGNVWLVDNDEHKGENRRADWDIDSFVQEHLRFKPDVTVKRLGGSKDRIDSCSGAFNLLSGINVNSIPLRVIDLGKRNAGRAKVLFCSEAELPSILIDRPALLVHIGDSSPLPERQPDMPVHGLSRLMGRVWVRFADIDPAEVQDRWNEAIPHIGLKPEQCILTREIARKVWGFLLKRTDPPYEAVVFCSETADRRARTLAYAFVDSLGYRRNEVILSHDGMYSNYDGPPPNNHIYAMFKAGRAGMMG